MARYHGRHGQVAINDAIVIGLNKWTLDMTTDLADSTAFGDGYKSEVQGLANRKGDFSGYLDTSSSPTLLAALDSTVPVTLKLTPTTDLSGQFFSGPAWVNMTVTVDIKDTVKVDCKWSGAPIPDGGEGWTAEGFA